MRAFSNMAALQGFGSQSASSNMEHSGHAHEHSGECCKPGDDKNGAKVPTIFDAVKSGMLVPVQMLVEALGVQCLSTKDEKGHYPAHWACLGGHTTILRYIIDLKGPVDEPSENDMGQTPIHWACVNGHIAIVDILLQAGINIDVVDSKGCTPLIVACQYGKTMLAGYLMGKGARMQVTDKEGDTALHWAAFKGFNELMRLLIFSGFNPHQRDKYGQTPLHLAAISGNLTSVTELCELDNAEIDIMDKNGKTPIMLATGRKHHKIVQYIKKQVQARKRLLPKIDIWAIVFGPPGNTKSALVFLIVSLFCWAYPMYIFKCLPYTWFELQTLHMFFMFTNVIMLLCLYHAATIDPGYLPRNIPEYDRAIKEVAHFDEWKQGQNPLSRLCHTCRTIKPLRSKHCRACNRCVEMFDHHCPYIYNCVGVRNRVSFLGFTLSITTAGFITLYFQFYLWPEYAEVWYYKYGFLQTGFFLCIAVFVFCYTVVHMAFNLTTNERINRKRYQYLKDGTGKYYNPFDRGLKNNILEFFHLKRYLVESDVELLNVNVV